MEANIHTRPQSREVTSVGAKGRLERREMVSRELNLSFLLLLGELWRKGGTTIDKCRGVVRDCAENSHFVRGSIAVQLTSFLTCFVYAKIDNRFTCLFAYY